MLPPSKATVFSIYRSFRRQIKLLPSEYLRQFFRIKLADDVRKVYSANTEQLQRTKLKRVQQELRKLQAAHAGDHQAYAHVLDVAYGRKGKLRWEIMKPLLSDPTAPSPDRIIPAVEKSRPPVYSPELTALLTSGLSRTTAKALSPTALVNPTTLPDRANPESELGRLLGPLSKRREVNIRWRYFTDQWKKVYPPLQVEVVDQPTANAEEQRITDQASLVNVGIRPVGLQGTGVYEDLVAAAGPAVTPQLMTRRERAEAGADQNSGTQSTTPLPRFIRRRYRELIARIPTLVYSRKPAGSKSGTNACGKYAVTLAGNALNSDTRHSANKIPTAHDSYLAWVDASDNTHARKKSR